MSERPGSPGVFVRLSEPTMRIVNGSPGSTSSSGESSPPKPGMFWKSSAIPLIASRPDRETAVATATMIITEPVRNLHQSAGVRSSMSSSV